MPAFLLSSITLLFSWTIAYLVAVPTAFLVRSTGLVNIPVLRVFRPLAENVRVKGLRKLFFATIIIGLAFFLSTMLDTQPASKLLKIYIQKFVNFELTQTLMNGLLVNLMLSLGVFIIYQAILFTNTFFPRLITLLQSWRYSKFHVIRLKSMELLTPDQITDFLLSLTRYIQNGITIILVITGITYTLSFFPGTQGLAYTIVETTGDILISFRTTIFGFLPNLLTLIFIIIVTYFTLKLWRFFYEGVQNNKIRIFGLHKDLVEPTYQLLRFFTFALALVAAYPFLPGSNSPVFRGITIFVGFLLSLGSTALATNIISGVVLTYTRGLRVGDRVKIGTTIGDVVERTILVTRLRTIKNVVISIPNSMVLNNEIINYSSSPSREGLILHTTVTIGYDVPWRKVHNLLINSAIATRYIQSEPKPFVLQTSLDDYYVSYELNAYTVNPKRMAVIYSELHQNIQDYFNNAGVEIMSPAYMAYREGNMITVPSTDKVGNNKAAHDDIITIPL
jgi:small-conductance mechanosensitive channel